MTVLRERADRELARCCYFDHAKCRDNMTPHPAHMNIYDCKTRAYDGVPLACPAFEFTQTDIYRNYYRLEKSRRMAIYTDTVYFRHTPDSNKIYGATMRSLKNLEEKGLIFYSKSGDTTLILLTDIGRTVAEKLLSDKSITGKALKKKPMKAGRR